MAEKDDWVLNERTLNALEYPKILQQLITFTGTPFGKELAEALRPDTNLSRVREGLQITSEALYFLQTKERPPFGGIFDIRAALQRAVRKGVLAPVELLEIASTARVSRLMRDFLRTDQDDLQILPEWGGRLGSYLGMEREIERCLGPEGAILDNASPKLHGLRAQSKILQSRIRDKLDGIIRSSENSKYLQELIVTVRNERYVIPVKQEYRSMFPGIVHDQSSSGATLFIEPMALVELNNQLRSIESQEQEEIQRILSELSARVAEIAEPLQISVVILGRLDLAFAKGKYSLELGGVEPELDESGAVELRQARHPLLKGKVVPITVVLGKDFDTLVITGPNTGGKTVTLKTVGLLTLMAQSGLHIPALSGSRIALFDHIYCDIGDEQSIEQSLSTFSSHMTQIVKILEEAVDLHCLVLLDELGAGTDPSEGAALAMSILSHLHRRGVRTIATTHYSELKAFAYKLEGIENASVEFDIETLRPTYHLVIGLPGSSQAFEIALKLGLSQSLVEGARQYISAETAQVEAMLKQIENDRRKSREDRRVTEESRLKAEQFKARYETELAQLKSEKEQLLRQARAEAREVLATARRESENLLRRLRESSQEELAQAANEARQQLTEGLAKLDEQPKEVVRGPRLDPAKLKIGSRVRALTVDKTGTVLEMTNDGAVVQIGIMKVSLPLSELELMTQPDQGKERIQLRKTGATGWEARQTITAEISLRGMTVDEALYQLEKYLDQAILAGLKRFRVIHGKGTGALRQAVQKYLRENSVVKSVTFAEQNEGGLGATVVEL